MFALKTRCLIITIELYKLILNWLLWVPENKTRAYEFQFVYYYKNINSSTDRAPFCSTDCIVIMIEHPYKLHHMPAFSNKTPIRSILRRWKPRFVLVFKWDVNDSTDQSFDKYILSRGNNGSTDSGNHSALVHKSLYWIKF